MKKNLFFFLAIFACFVSKAQLTDKAQAMQLVIKNSTALGLSTYDLENVTISDSYFDKTAAVSMVYLQQAYKKIPVYNQLQVLAFKNGGVVSKTGKFISSLDKKVNNNTGIAVLNPALAVQAAIADRKLVAKGSPVAIPGNSDGRKVEFGDLGVSRQNITAELNWVPLSDGRQVRLAWMVYIIPTTTPDYWMIRVDATNGSILGMDNYTVYCNWDKPGTHDFCTHAHAGENFFQNLFDFTHSPLPAVTTVPGSPDIISSASYRVVPFPAESPIHLGGAHALVTNPWAAALGNATTLKWHNNGTTDFTITRGNNVWAQEDRNNNNGTGTAATSTTTPDPLTFDFTPNYTVTPTQTTPVPNQQFNTTNLFYWNNIIHDITYQYGFDEVSGNFQSSNLNRGGLGNDHVLADAQDGGGTNNANFSTPGDGQSGRMQMYLWNGSPQKDGDVDNGIVVHEYGHGISTRLTGGPSQSGCLSNAEQMGEGWSDYYGLMYTQNWATSTLTTGFNSPRGVGTYAVGQGPTGTGIRSQKYCTNFSINNKVYAPNISAESHNRGEIWCAVLWDMTWNIINQVGTINPNIYNAAGSGGNTIALKLVTEGMKLQPCSPGFIDGRDAIIEADQILYGGVHECAIREAFRRRGMGAFASQGSSSSVSDQIADYTLGGAGILLTQNGMTQVPEGELITYTNTVNASACGDITNFLLTDTLPSNVTYVSGGTYNAGTRVVSFPVNLTAAQSQAYTFTVRVNTGAYFPTVTLFEDNVTTAAVPPIWTTNSTTAVNWVVSNARSHSAPSSYYSFNQDVQSDQKLFSTNAIALGATPPMLSFWHWYNAESTYDGGVLEISTNGGTTWTDVEPNIISGGYTGTMDPSTIIPNRRAWTGSSNDRFIKTKVNMMPYANQSVKLRFRFTTDVGTNQEGWYVDDIAIKDQPVVEIKSNLFTTAGVRVGVSDTITIITAPSSCTNVTTTTAPANTLACNGGNASFSVAVTGTDPIYQWQVSTDNGISFSNIPGANNDTLDLAGVTASMNNNQYQVVITNACPSTVTSSAAVLTVNQPAAITTQPSAVTACSGTGASFTVATSGSSNTYQWQVSTDGGTTFQDIPGATAATLNLPSVSSSLNNNQYHVVVFSCSAAGLTSSNVTLTVNNPASFVTQPSNITVCAATNTSFTVVAAGTNVTYQWQVSTNGGVTFSDIPGEVNPTLNIPAVTPALNDNQYHVIISNACGASVISTNAVLTVSNTASIATQPINTIACASEATTITAVASGIAYQWQVSEDGGLTFSDIPGAITPLLDILNVTTSLNGNQYHLIVSTCGTGSLTSNNVTLTVINPIAVTSQPDNEEVCDGGNAVFSVTATGTSPVYQWEVSVDQGISFSAIPGANGPVLTLPAVDLSQNGNIYRAMISNACTVNFTSDNAVLTVNAATLISSQASSDTACAGSDVSFTVVASGSGLQFQWQESTDGGITFTDLVGATSATLPLSDITASMNNNQYRVLVTGCNNLISTPVLLGVNPLPGISITASPYTSISTDQTTTLTATITGTGASFNWYNNDVLIAGASSGSITVAHTALGTYQAEVTDAASGCTNRSNVITITDSAINFAFIYPNPSNGFFQVRFEGVEPAGKSRLITMYDSKGARVYSKRFTVQTSYEIMNVHAEKLSGGVYAVVLSDSNGKTLGSRKIIIRH